MLDIATEINILLAKEGLNRSALAKAINTSSQNLTMKFKRNNPSVNEIQEWANALGYDVEIKFIKKGE